jgi:hypothetical protein
MTDLLSRRAASRIEARKGGNAAPVAAVPAAPAQNLNKLAAIREDARVRTAAAWTTAKNLLPDSPVAVQHRLAAALISAPTPVLTATLRSVARLAFYTKAAEKFEAETKQDLNEFVDNEAMLNKLRSEVVGELKTEDPLKTAANKKAEVPPPVADDPTQPAPPAEPAPAAAMPAPGGKGGEENKGEFNEPAPAGDAAPGAMGDGGMGVDEASPANEANGSHGEEGSLLGQIEGVEGDIHSIENEVEQAGEEFDLNKIFNPEVQADKAQNLANQGDNMEEMGNDDFFSPSEMGDMMNKSEVGGEHETAAPEDFFGKGASADPMSMFFGKEASEDVDVEMGDMASHFETDLPGDDRDSETDHGEDLLTDVLDSLSQPDMKQKRDVEPNLETPGDPTKLNVKANAPRKSSIKSVGNPVPAKKEAASSDASIESLIFGSDDF